MTSLPDQLRKFGNTRKQLGGHPDGYKLFFDAADEIEQLRDTVDNLQFHNRGLQDEMERLK